jgi:hypothetical protein
VCVYKGVPYTQGQQWYDGCDKVCVCESGMTGYIRCRQRCSTYTKSDECTMVPDPKDPIGVSEWLLWTPIQQFFSYIMARTS